MRVLVTGHLGYFGSVLSHVLCRAGHDVAGLDCDLFAGCDFGRTRVDVPRLDADIRDVEGDDLAGFDAIVHLAALPEDWPGRLDPDLFEEINFQATLRLASYARRAGVPRFLFASSCAVYGRGTGELLDEESPVEPLTPYATSKLRCERAMARLAGSDFAPVFLRNATLYGVSPRLRLDTVVNDFVCSAVTTGRVAMKTVGRACRPLLHVEDAARAYLAVLSAPAEQVCNQVFNVADTAENYRIIDVADTVTEWVPGTVRTAARDVFDPRTYRVSAGKLMGAFPELSFRWNVRAGIGQLRRAITDGGITAGDWRCNRYRRVMRLQSLMEKGALDVDLRAPISTMIPCFAG